MCAVANTKAKLSQHGCKGQEKARKFAPARSGQSSHQLKLTSGRRSGSHIGHVGCRGRLHFSIGARCSAAQIKGVTLTIALAARGFTVGRAVGGEAGKRVVIQCACDSVRRVRFLRRRHFSLILLKANFIRHQGDKVRQPISDQWKTFIFPFSLNSSEIACNCSKIAWSEMPSTEKRNPPLSKSSNVAILNLAGGRPIRKRVYADTPGRG